MPACTVFWIWFSASETATATAKPAGASEAASEPAATSASMVETSLAQTVTVSAEMPVPRSPLTRARTLAALRLTAEAPEPAAVAAKPRLPTTAAEKASTMLSMFCSDLAVTSSLPPALMPVFSVVACTSNVAESSWVHWLASAKFCAASTTWLNAAPPVYWTSVPASMPSTTRTTSPMASTATDSSLRWSIRSSQPMSLRAMATPMDRPAPANSPATAAMAMPSISA